MKFGKQIQADQVPGWSPYYLDYKALKKIISSLAANQPASEDTAFAIAESTRPGDDDLSLLPPGIAQDEERGPRFQACKTAFFFKLERELEKINTFYIEKEAELTMRLETLLMKRRAAATRVRPDSMEDNTTKDHVEWSAVEEGFHLLERDLAKLQQFVEINAIGFRKILKKWDKRSKSTTKELYLSRQVDVQPVFNRQLISELADTVAACLLDLTDLSVGVNHDGALPEDVILAQQLSTYGSSQMGPFQDLESNIRKAVADSDRNTLRDLVRYSESLCLSPAAKMHATRILWKAVIDAPPDLADHILTCASNPFDYHFVDDINGRTCLHEAARVGALRLVNLCLDNGVEPEKVDVYGRSALHYAAMNGHASVCHRLLEVGLPANALDLDNCTPLIYATLRGSVDCVKVILEDGKVSVQGAAGDNDLMPLSLAARSGHYDVVVLLLSHGAPSLPNTNGEYPIHLAAQAGHSNVCRLLVRQEGWDTLDKYNEWTPLFHAARYGHADCLNVLLEAGCATDRTDEVGNSALHYAAWYGHNTCIPLLITAIARNAALRTPVSHTTPLTNTQKSIGSESDIDAIPSLSLPPPMMPYRVYGHNYLDKNSLVQVSIGLLMSNFGESSADPSHAVRLRPPLSGLEHNDRYLHASPRLRLVLTASPAVTAAPYSIPLPLTDERVVFTFQVPSVQALTLEFSLYPNFGTKIIGRATTLPITFSSIRNNHALTLPILDHRLNVIGEVSFTVNVVTPFSGVTLEIGGAVETYWKSIASPASAPAAKLITPRAAPPARSIGSALTSPATHSMATVGSHSLTHSSVSGSYIYLTVQVTRDLQPVVYLQWRLPEEMYDLGVADVTLAQFSALASRLGRTFAVPPAPVSLTDLHNLIAHSMTPLSDLLKMIPATLGICIEVAYPSPAIRDQLSLRHQIGLNDAVDAVLRTIYDTTTHEGHGARRNVVFTSFSPDVCLALNWKQPNYPVFFASQCARRSAHPPSATALALADTRDYRLASLHAAVELCKLNNLLGLLLDAELLHQVPSLIQGVKDFGLLLGAFGGPQHGSVRGPGDATSVDAFLQDGVLTYADYSRRI